MSQRNPRLFRIIKSRPENQHPWVQIVVPTFQKKVKTKLYFGRIQSCCFRGRRYITIPTKTRNPFTSRPSGVVVGLIRRWFGPMDPVVVPTRHAERGNPCPGLSDEECEERLARFAESMRMLRATVPNPRRNPNASRSHV